MLLFSNVTIRTLLYLNGVILFKRHASLGSLIKHAGVVRIVFISNGSLFVESCILQQLSIFCHIHIAWNITGFVDTSIIFCIIADQILGFCCCQNQANGWHEGMSVECWSRIVEYWRRKEMDSSANIYELWGNSCKMSILPNVSWYKYDCRQKSCETASTLLVKYWCIMRLLITRTSNWFWVDLNDYVRLVCFHWHLHVIRSYSFLTFIILWLCFAGSVRAVRLQSTISEGFWIKAELQWPWRCQVGSLHRQERTLRDTLLKFPSSS